MGLKCNCKPFCSFSRETGDEARAEKMSTFPIPRSESTHHRLYEFAKTAMIKIFAHPYVTVCDLYCGAGVDIDKWESAQIANYVGIGMYRSFYVFAIFIIFFVSIYSFSFSWVSFLLGVCCRCCNFRNKWSKGRMGGSEEKLQRRVLWSWSMCGKLLL